MPTQLLLLEDVDDLGRSGDLVSVKPGFARNYLLPQRKALFADENARRMQARLQEERAKKAAVDKQAAEEVAARMDDLVLTIVVKVDHEGHMYGSVSALDVVRLLQEQHGVALEKKMVQLAHAIKETGVHAIRLKLKEGVPASLKLKVLAEGAKEEEETPTEETPEEQENQGQE